MNIAAILPRNDNVLVRVIKRAEKTVGSIVVVENGRFNGPRRAEVLAVGPGRVTDEGKLIESTLRTGAFVLVPELGGVDIDLGDGAKGLIFPEGDILAELIEG